MSGQRFGERLLMLTGCFFATSILWLIAFAGKIHPYYFRMQCLWGGGMAFMFLLVSLIGLYRTEMAEREFASVFEVEGVVHGME